MNLLNELWADLQQLTTWWQIGVALLCWIASYFVSQFLQRRLPINTNVSEADLVVAQSFSNIRFPGVFWAFLLLGELSLSHWQTVQWLALLTLIVGSFALVRFGIYLSRRIFMRHREMSSVHLFIEKLFSSGVWIVAILYYIGVLQDIWTFMEQTSISIGRNPLSIADIFQALISVVITVLLALWASAALDKRLMKVQTLHTSFRMVLSRLGRSLLILFAVLISLNLVGIDLTVLSVFGGALGVGLGLGLQRIASNYLSGFIILLERSLSIGDTITVDKYSGQVREIKTRYTVLKGTDGIESVIPNEMLVSSPVQNLSLTDREVWMSTEVAVAYSTDIEALIPLLVKAVSSVPRVSSKLPPGANLIRFGANGLELKIGFWINDPENGQLSVLSQVNRAIWKLLQEQKVEVPYPQTEIRILEKK